MKKQAYELINSMDDKMLGSAIQLLTNLKVHNGVQILWGNSNDIYASLPNTLLKVMQYDDSIGPKKKYILQSTPFKIPITAIIDDYIINNAEKFVGVPDGYVIKNNDEVLIQCGDKVIYGGYIFYAKYNGSVSHLYVSEKDLKLATAEEDSNKESTVQKYWVGTKELQKFVLIDNLENELKLYKERHECWVEHANWTSSGE